MIPLDNLKKIYPKCWLYNTGYWYGQLSYAVLSDVDNMKILGTGNTPKNAYSNALYNCNNVSNKYITTKKPAIITNTILYAAWCGTGKTYICNRNNIDAIEVEYWKYKEKNLQHKYIQIINSYIGKVKYIFISTKPDGLKLLNNAGFNITLVYPSNDLRNEYLDRYIERDSAYELIGTFIKHWHIWLDELKEQTYCKHIILKSGKYLSNII